MSTDFVTTADGHVMSIHGSDNPISHCFDICGKWPGGIMSVGHVHADTKEEADSYVSGIGLLEYKLSLMH